nr:MAG: NSP1a protein [Avian astrovirus 14]
MNTMDKLCIEPTMEKCFTTMRNYFGNSSTWKNLMQCDAVYIKNITEAYGVRDGKYYIFDAVRNLSKGGWDCKFEEVQIMSDIKIVLDLHTASRQRMKNYALLASARADEVLRKQQDIIELKNVVKSKDQHIDQLNLEIKLLRESYRTVSLCREKPANITPYKYTNCVLAVVVLLLALLLQPAAAVDCSDYISGCYVEQGPGEAMTYTEFTHICFGKTRTILTTGQVSEQKLVDECVGVMQTQIGSPYVFHWCKHNIKSRIHYVTCDKIQLFEDLKQQYLLIKNFLNGESWYGPALEHFSHLCALAMILLGGNPLLNFAVYMVGYFLSVPPFMLAIAVTTFPPITFGFVIASLFFPLGFKADVLGVFCAHWVIGTIFTYATTDNPMVKVSSHLFYSILGPIWYIVNYLVIHYKIKTSLQIIIFVVGLTWSIGLRYVNTTVTVASPDGEIKKYKRYELMGDSIKRTIARVQSNLRGIIPAIPDKSDHIVCIHTSNGSGVGFRFMNQICTLGHVVGTDKVVKVSWKGITCTTHVYDEIPLWESADTLVRLKIPSELQSLKPLRLTKNPVSDYMALVTFDQQGQLAQFSGWNMIDGVWLSNTFETFPGTSGSPYVDRHGRLVAIHMGTQGVIGQGYVLYDTLHNKLPLGIDGQTPVVNPQCGVDVDVILEKVIQGTRVSHAALTSEIEKLIEMNKQLAQSVDELNERVMKQHYRIMELEKPMVELEKKKKKKKVDKSEVFKKIKVLTEEEYKRMLEEGWSADQIQDAVKQLREAAWIDFEEHQEDWDPEEIERQMEEEMDQYLRRQAKPDLTKEQYSAKHGIIAQAKRRPKGVKFRCRYCTKYFTEFHDIDECRQTKNGKKGKEVASP